MLVPEVQAAAGGRLSVLAADRAALVAETRRFEAAEREIDNWGFERRRQDEQRARFFAERRRIRLSSKPDSAHTAIFHGTKQETKAQRIARERQEKLEERERQERKRLRDAEARARRGRGPVRKCPACQRTIYRGEAATCGCKPCAHCGKRFRGASYKCDPCKHANVTAYGTETRSFVPHREAQPTITPLSARAQRIDALLDQIPDWMRDAIHHRYRLKETDRDAAENLMIPIPTFAGRARAAVARIAELLANGETARV